MFMLRKLIHLCISKPLLCDSFSHLQIQEFTRNTRCTWCTPADTAVSTISECSGENRFESWDCVSVCLEFHMFSPASLWVSSMFPTFLPRPKHPSSRVSYAKFPLDVNVCVNVYLWCPVIDWYPSTPLNASVQLTAVAAVVFNIGEVQVCYWACICVCFIYFICWYGPLFSVFHRKKKKKVST